MIKCIRRHNGVTSIKTKSFSLLADKVFSSGIYLKISFASRGVLSRGTRAWTLDQTIAMTGHCPQIVLFPFASRSIFSSLLVIYILFFIFHSLKAGLEQANVPAVCSPQPAVLMCARLEELGVGFGEGVRVKWPHWGRFISLPHPLP